MTIGWFMKRTYNHFDRPIGEPFATKAMKPDYVAQHSFSPLIHYLKIERRYKPAKAKTEDKARPIKFASHRDACVFSYYAHQLEQHLNAHYAHSDLAENVIAYRALGKGNYDFAANAYAYAKQHSPIKILAFDVTGFFDNLDHYLLKTRLKLLLGVSELSVDWLKIFRAVTRFTFVDLDDLKLHPTFGQRIREKTKKPIASIAELKSAGIAFRPNPTLGKGIPQGTPISAILSNVYMLEFDEAIQTYCNQIGALYRRYSDDILVVCKQNDAAGIESEVLRLMTEEQLELSPTKTERTDFNFGTKMAFTGRTAQYLGFTFGNFGASIRPSSLSKQWRKLRRAVRRIRHAGVAAISSGAANKVYTKKLRRRFSSIKYFDGKSVQQLRNFSSYGRRSAAAFGTNENIVRQVRRFESAAAKEIDILKRLKP